MLYIYHHLGLGDHIICNGMVRHFCDIHDEIILFCHDHYKENIKYMYRDNPKIKIEPTTNEYMINLFLSQTKQKYIKIGFEKLREYENSNLTFDQAFYDIAGLEFDIRFDKFFVQRDEKKESEAYEKNNPNDEKYIYVHDDPSRGFTIDSKKHRNDLKIIKNDKNYNLFEMRKILESAEEIHTMQTGMLDLCNSIKLDKPSIFLHTYVRNYPDFVHSKGINFINKI